MDEQYHAMLDAACVGTRVREDDRILPCPVSGRRVHRRLPKHRRGVLGARSPLPSNVATAARHSTGAAAVTAA